MTDETRPLEELRLSPDAYLPRRTLGGGEVRDLMPWEGALRYVTDGIRYGVEYAGDPSAGLYGSAPVPEVLAALDAAEEVEGELEERFRVFHSLVTFEEELEGNGVGKGHYLPQGREG